MVQENAVKALPARSEVAVEDTWRLEDIYATEEDWEDAFQAVKRDLLKVDAYKGTLCESADKLFAVLQYQNQVWEKLGKAYTYSHMRYDQDTTTHFTRAWIHE